MAKTKTIRQEILDYLGNQGPSSTYRMSFVLDVETPIIAQACSCLQYQGFIECIAREKARPGKRRPVNVWARVGDPMFRIETPPPSRADSLKQLMEEHQSWLQQIKAAQAERQQFRKRI
jgi:hypothetical protein